MGSRPVDPAAPRAAPKTGSGGKDERRQHLGHFFPLDRQEVTVAFTASRVFEGRGGVKGEAREHLDQLVVEHFAAHQQCPRPD